MKGELLRITLSEKYRIVKNRVGKFCDFKPIILKKYRLLLVEGD